MRRRPPPIPRTVLRAFPATRKTKTDGTLTRKARKARAKTMAALLTRGFRVTKDVFAPEVNDA